MGGPSKSSFDRAVGAEAWTADCRRGMEERDGDSGKDPPCRICCYKGEQKMKRYLEGQMDLGGWVGVHFNMGGTVACLH